MTTKVEIPALGESVTQAVIIEWLKNDGDRVAIDEPLCELETDKANVELPAPAAGVLRRFKQAGDTVQVGETIAQIESAEAIEKPQEPVEASPTAASPPPPHSNAKPPAKTPQSSETRLAKTPTKSEAPQEAFPRAIPEVAPASSPKRIKPPLKKTTPASRDNATDQPQGASSNSPTAPGKRQATKSPDASPETSGDNGERRVPMSNIRRRIAQRLVQSQQTAAMLTTFNEIDMTAVLDLRGRYQEQFTEAFGVSLGLMSFFAHASAVALTQFPILNAQIDGDDIIYHDGVHLGLAVSTERGLVVPVLRNVETMSLANIEAEIKRVAAAARDGKLKLEELSGGTFTLTNGGVFGSLLSTPILNPPQAGILGMHTIQKRPVVVKNRIRARPMMYVALTYDHRLVDGRESVLFLVRLKELLEDPARMLLQI